MSRKTMEVAKILEIANAELARTDGAASQDFKKGVSILLEMLLHETDNYRGFNYSYWLDTGYEQWVKDGEPVQNQKYLGFDYDRRYYRA